MHARLCPGPRKLCHFERGRAVSFNSTVHFLSHIARAFRPREESRLFSKDRTMNLTEWPGQESLESLERQNLTSVPPPPSARLESPIITFWSGKLNHLGEE